METTVANVKRWSSDNKEIRIYVRMVNGAEGCKYITGNRYHAPKSVDGNMTEDAWKEAKKVGVWDQKWHTVYESELHGTIFGKPVNTSTSSNQNFKTAEDDNELAETATFRSVGMQGESELFG